MASEALLPYISTERLVFEDITGITQRIGVIMKYNDFIHVPDDIGGHVSVFLWYPAYVTDKEGNTRREIIFRLGVSNHTYLSNFGGGFKANKGGIVRGLEKELDEEIPLWKDHIMKEIEKSSKGGDHCLFLGLHQRLADHIKPIYKHGKKRSPTTVKVIIFVPVSPEYLNHVGFEISPEIRGIVDKTLPEFHWIVDQHPTVGSDSISIYHTFRKKMSQNPFLKNTLETYFEKDLPTTVELTESNLTNSLAIVTLMNGITKLRFSNIRYNNKNASKNAEEAWKMRKEYGKKVMKWQPGMPRIYPPITSRSMPASPPSIKRSFVMENEKDDKNKNSLERSSSSGSKNKTVSRTKSPSPSESPSLFKSFKTSEVKKENNNDPFIEITTRAQRKTKKNMTRRNKK